MHAFLFNYFDLVIFSQNVNLLSADVWMESSQSYSDMQLTFPNPT